MLPSFPPRFHLIYFRHFVILVCLYEPAALTERCRCRAEASESEAEKGKDLIRYFCTPCKPTKANGGRTRNLPEHDPEKWERFKFYTRRDVDVEMAIQKRFA